MLPRVLEHSERPGFSDLASLAASVRADLFIGHYPAGLAAAARAAKNSNALFAYDAEDLYAGEHPKTRSGRRVAKLIDTLERRYINECAYVSASSPGIGEALENRYEIAPPVVIQNTFPWTDRDSMDGKILDRKSDGLSVYWFSQTIGPGRGIEDAVKACGTLGGGVDLHLRGTISQGYASRLYELASTFGVEQSLYIHSQVPYDQVLSRTAEHDVGLALEQPTTLSRNLCQTNKLFVYLLAGIAVAATDTPGQRLVMDLSHEAGISFSPGDHDSLAAFLKSLRDDPARLKSRKMAALRSAREDWNWEVSKSTLVQAVNRVFAN